MCQDHYQSNNNKIFYCSNLPFTFGCRSSNTPINLVKAARTSPSLTSISFTLGPLQFRVKGRSAVSTSLANPTIYFIKINISNYLTSKNWLSLKWIKMTDNAENVYLHSNLHPVQRAQTLSGHYRSWLQHTCATYNGKVNCWRLLQLVLQDHHLYHS